MDKLNIASLLVAIVAALGAWSAQRASAKASVTNTNTTSRVDMEKEAYDRARAFDTETINRQNTRIEELEHEVEELKEDKKKLQDRVSTLERALTRGVTLKDLETIREHRTEDDGTVSQ